VRLKLQQWFACWKSRELPTQLGEWGVADQLNSMCFDSMPNNTGHRNGACVWIEQNLKKYMLHFACRHHIFELVLASIFSETVSVSAGPDVSDFKRFQKAWPTIDQERFETAANDEMVSILKDDRDAKSDSVMSFAINQFFVNQPRDDYQEFLEVGLTIIFWTEFPPVA